jgi:DICT domain-containing protein
MMIALSYAIEEHAAASGPHTVLVATFQRLSLFRPQASRYARLAPQLAQAFALGVPDAPAASTRGVTLLPLEASWPLVQEWVVIASGRSCCAALFSRDAEGFRPGQRSQRFAGRWTTNPDEVVGALQRFYAAIGQAPPAELPSHQAGQRSATAIRRALARR